jgi:dCTP deaminase
MAVFSDIRIIESIYRHELGINPFIPANVKPSSIDLTLDVSFRKPKSDQGIINVYDKDFEKYYETITGPIVLKSKDFIIGQIKEQLTLSKNMTGTILNRNSLIRMGLNVNLSTYINPGYQGQLPIVLNNIGDFSLELIPGMRICQLVLYDVEPMPNQDYKSQSDAKYYDEQDITLPKLYLDTEFRKYTEEKGISKKINPTDVQSFFEKEIEEASEAFFNNMSKEELERIGL